MIEGNGARWGERDVALKGGRGRTKKEEEAVEADERNEKEKESDDEVCLSFKGKSFQSLKKDGESWEEVICEG